MGIMTSDDRMPRLVLVAHHEAGHAVAAALRGSRFECSMPVGLDSPHHLDRIGNQINPADVVFVAAAGLWAEARALWGDQPLADEDAENRVFEEYLDDVYASGAGTDDATYVEAHIERLSAYGLGGQAVQELRLTTESRWRSELELAWPAVQAIATRLLAGEQVTADQVTHAVWGDDTPDGWTGELDVETGVVRVVPLVKPLYDAVWSCGCSYVGPRRKQAHRCPCCGAGVRSAEPEPIFESSWIQHLGYQNPDGDPVHIGPEPMYEWPPELVLAGLVDLSPIESSEDHEPVTTPDLPDRRYEQALTVLRGCP